MLQITPSRGLILHPGPAPRFIQAVQLELHRHRLGSYASLGSLLSLLDPTERLELIKDAMYVGYDAELQTFFAHGGASSEVGRLNFCPHRGCRTHSESTVQCDHFREEFNAAGRSSSPVTVLYPIVDVVGGWSLADELYSTIFKDLSISWEGIRFIMDMVATRRGVKDRHSEEGQLQLLESLGSTPFFDLELEVSVTRAGHYSHSASIQPTRQLATFMTCSAVGCDREGVIPLASLISYVCILHKPLVADDPRGPHLTKFIAAVKLELLEKVSGHRRMDRHAETEWIEALKYLNSYGEMGYAASDVNMEPYIRLVSGIALVVVRRAVCSPHVAFCIWMHCTGRPHGTNTQRSQLPVLRASFPKGPKIRNLDELSRLVMCTNHYATRGGRELVARLCREQNVRDYGTNHENRSAYGPHAHRFPLVRDAATQRALAQFELVLGATSHSLSGRDAAATTDDEGGDNEKGMDMEQDDAADGDAPPPLPTTQSTTTTTTHQSIISLYLDLGRFCHPGAWELDTEYHQSLD